MKASAAIVCLLVVAGCGELLGSRHDDALREDLARALIERPDANLLEVEVEVEDAVAYLTGEVRDHDRKQKAEATALGVAGIKSVVSNILIEP